MSMSFSARPATSNQLNELVYQTAHGFTVGQPLIYNGTTYQLSKSDTLAHCAGTVIVSFVQSPNSFYVAQIGYINNITQTLVAGTLYYISAATAGLYTSTPPNVPGQIVLPCLIATTTSAGFFTSGSGVAITSGPVFGWTVVGVNTPLAINQGYIASSGGTINLTLPAVFAVGDIIRITNLGGEFSIKQNAGQTINIGNDNTTVGVGGSLTSTSFGDTVELLGVNANVEMQVISAMGNLNYV